MNLTSHGSTLKHLTLAVIIGMTIPVFGQQISATIHGRITDASGQPVANAHVYLQTQSLGYQLKKNTLQCYADDSGAFQIVVPDATDVTAIAVNPPDTRDHFTGLERDVENLSLKPGDALEINLTLAHSKSVTVDYVFQPNGTRDFGVGAVAGTMTCKRPDTGFDFTKGTSKNGPMDLMWFCKDGQWAFKIVYVHTKGFYNGFYDAGPVSLDTVNEADKTDCKLDIKPAVVGHTYVLSTNDGNYVKFTVKSIDEQ